MPFAKPNTRQVQEFGGAARQLAALPPKKALLLAAFAVPALSVAAFVPDWGEGTAKPGFGPAATKDAGLKISLAGPDKSGPDKAGDTKTAFLEKSVPAGPVAQPLPFFFTGDQSDKDRAVDCLAAAAWYEAGGDEESQRSVVQVVLNRVRHKSFPNSVCGVVFQGAERKTGCQFTFTCDGSFSRRPSALAWARARKVAQAMLDGKVDNAVHQATHYHANYVTPWWSSKLVRLSTVGAHIFYAWPGAQGLLKGSRNGPAAESNIGWLSTISGSHQAKLDIPSEQAGLIPGQLAASDLTASGLDKTADTAANLALPGSLPQPGSGLVQPYIMSVGRIDLAGRWAIDAMNHCQGKAGCHVLAYLGHDEGEGENEGADNEIPEIPEIPEKNAIPEKPVFVFIRDRQSRMNLALWDCSRIARRDASQCLPDNQAALKRLVSARPAVSTKPERIARQFGRLVSERP